MCGIFGIIPGGYVNRTKLQLLAKHAQQRGQDSSGLALHVDGRCNVYKADYSVKKLLSQVPKQKAKFAFGHSRLVTNGFEHNQPVVSENSLVFHNGIIVNSTQVWKRLKLNPKTDLDSEIISALVESGLDSGSKIDELAKEVLQALEGSVSVIILLPRLGKVVLASNTGSLYFGESEGDIIVSSEKFPLARLKCKEIKQIRNDFQIFDLPNSSKLVEKKFNVKRLNLVPLVEYLPSEEKKLLYKNKNLRRCSKCVLPETMPFIEFDLDGVCNYCHSYKPRNIPKSKFELENLLEPYRRMEGTDCIVPFSGGRDSCYGLHLIVNELKMRPVAYTYDWGMVTDLGRRNISRMCSQLGVENIIVAANITKKRENIRKNLEAWLKNPHLGMLALLTAGDKHFFRHVETVKQQTEVNLNLWGVNPLEVTHFKAGFLGISPDFKERRVYSNGVRKQINYHFKRTQQMIRNPRYLNSSLFDTLSGEFYRSFKEKRDYFHIFDYWKWDENIVNSTLLNNYDWEVSPDTSTTWRIGDATAAFYNYVYHTVVGFSEHDTFRSNQIREGDISRDFALSQLEQENRPRYESIKWYIEVLGLDFSSVIDVINSIPEVRLD